MLLSINILQLPRGMIILKDKKLADKLRLTKAFGIDRTHGERKLEYMILLN